MREIPLKSVAVTLPPGTLSDGEIKFHYSELIAAVLNSPPMGPNGQPMGFDISQQRSAFRVLDAVDAAVAAGAEIVKLEEPEYEFFKGRLSQMRWARLDKALIQFTDDINDAPKIDPNVP